MYIGMGCMKIKRCIIIMPHSLCISAPQRIMDISMGFSCDVSLGDPIPVRIDWMVRVSNMSRHHTTFILYTVWR